MSYPSPIIPWRGRVAGGPVVTISARLHKSGRPGYVEARAVNPAHATIRREGRDVVVALESMMDVEAVRRYNVPMP